MKTAIVTDTNSGFSAAEGKKMGIYVLPMPVIIDGQVLHEGQNITVRQLQDAMNSGRNISTSQPELMSLREIWEKAFAEGYDEVVHIPMSAGLSGSCAMAQQMAREYDGRVQVADNRRISIPMHESVLDAKAMADRGMTAEKIRTELESHADESVIYLIVDSMKYLEKGGRITHGAAVMGSLLKIKPVLTIRDEKIDACAKARGMVSAKRKMCEFLRSDYEERFSSLPKEQVAVGCASVMVDEQELEQFCGQLTQLFPGHVLLRQELPCSIACHVGPGTIGAGLVVRRR